MLIAEDLLLLLLEDDSGRLTNRTYLDTGLGGALLVELALGEHVQVAESSGWWGRAKVQPTAAPPPGDPLLVEALALVAERERTAQELVGRLGKNRREPLLERLVSSGALQRRDDRILGLFPRRRWPARDLAHKADLRRRLGDAIVRGVSPEPRTAALVAVLSAMELAHKVVHLDGLSGREAKARAKEIADGDWAAKAVKDAIRAAQAAMTAAAAAGAATAATSG